MKSRTLVSKRLILLVLGFAAVPLCAQTVYKLPPKEIVDVVSQPIVRLGGLRISPAIGVRQRLQRFTGISVQRFDGGPARSIAVPAGARIGLSAAKTAEGSVP